MSTRGRGRAVLGGLGLGYLNTALVIVVGLWLTPFLLRHLGQDRYGLWLLAAQILMYLALMDLGVVAILPREVAYATGRAGGYEHAADLPDLIGHTARLVLWQMPVVAVGALVAWRMIPSSWGSLQWPLALVVLAFVLMFPLRLYHAVLHGLQDLSFAGAAQTGAWAAGTAVTVLLVWLGWGLYALAAGWITTQGLSALVFRWRLRHRFPDVVPNRLPGLSAAKARQQLGRGAWVSTSQVAQVLLNGTDIMIVGNLLGPAAVVPFACTGRLILLLANQPQALMQMAAPALSELRAGAARTHLFAVSAALGQAMLIGSGAVACVVLAANQGFVAWWVGKDQFGGAVLTQLMVVGMLLRHLNLTAAYTLFCYGQERRIAITAVADGLVTLAASVLLVRVFGLPGAVLGSIAGVVLVSLPGNLPALARENGVSIARTLMPFGPWFWRFALVALAAASLPLVWVPAGFRGLVLVTGATGAVYAAVMIPLLARPPLGHYLVPRLVLILAKVSRAFRRPVIGEPAG